MREKFILDGNKVEIEVLRKTFKVELLDVTSHTDQWTKYIHSGLLFLNLLIKTNNNEETNVTYQIMGENEGTLTLRSIKNG